MPEIKAHLKYLRVSPRKVRLVADMIRKQKVFEAEKRLKFLNKRAARPMSKLLSSAKSNAKHNFNLDSGNLYVKNLRVNEGPVLKRYMPRAFGRATMIRKRTSHITLVLDSTTKT